MNSDMKSTSKLVVYGDGGSRGNPGEAAYGFVVYNDKSVVLHEEGRRLGITTNNVAEYSAVVNALKWIIENCPHVKDISFFLDSLLVASQLSGKFKIKHPAMKELFIAVKQLESQLEAEITYTQIPRNRNVHADKMVNAALDDEV